MASPGEKEAPQKHGVRKEGWSLQGQGRAGGRAPGGTKVLVKDQLSEGELSSPSLLLAARAIPLVCHSISRALRTGSTKPGVGSKLQWIRHII